MQLYVFVKSYLWCNFKQVHVEFFKIVSKIHVAASTSTQISDHHILLQTIGWHKGEAN